MKSEGSDTLWYIFGMVVFTFVSAYEWVVGSKIDQETEA